MKPRCLLQALFHCCLGLFGLASILGIVLKITGIGGSRFLIMLGFMGDGFMTLTMGLIQFFDSSQGPEEDAPGRKDGAPLGP